ncbi:hypothetical protein LINPERPRIM_LOCUS35263, partial [Linum perenne]
MHDPWRRHRDGGENRVRRGGVATAAGRHARKDLNPKGRRRRG